MKITIKPVLEIEIFDDNHCSLECPFCNYWEGCTRAFAECALLAGEDTDELDIEFFGDPKMDHPVRSIKCKESSREKG